MTATEDKTAVDPWASLLSAATLEDTAERKARVKVPVPDAVLKLVRNAREKRQRITLPFDANTFEDVSNVFYSAGDLLEPKASVQVTRVNGEGKLVKDDTATHVRIFIGDRRGQKGKQKNEGEKAEKGNATA